MYCCTFTYLKLKTYKQAVRGVLKKFQQITVTVYPNGLTTEYS